MTAAVGILAAGASSRMRGRDKLLEDAEGEPLLARQLRVAARTGAPVLVALPPGGGERRRLVGAAGAEAVTVTDAELGMGHSIAALAAAAERRRAEGLLLLLADMPELTTADLEALLKASAASPDAVVRAAAEDGRPGHPVVFPRRLFAALQALTGDRGARSVLAQAPEARLVRLPGERALTDLDTPESWEAWRKRPRS